MRRIDQSAYADMVVAHDAWRVSMINDRPDVDENWKTYVDSCIKVGICPDVSCIEFGAPYCPTHTPEG